MIKNAPISKLIASAAIALTVATPIKKTIPSHTPKQRVDSKTDPKEKAINPSIGLNLAIITRLQRQRGTGFTMKKLVKGESSKSSR